MVTPVFPGFPNWPVTPPGPLDVEEVERRFWEIIDAIDRFTDRYRLPAPHLRPILEQFSLIDSDRLREVGENVWGTGAAHPGIPARLALELPDRVSDSVGKAAERWHGPAFNQFKGWMGELRETLRKFPEPAQQVGQLLVDLAEKFKLSWIGIIGLVAEVAGLVLAIMGAEALLVPEPVISKAAGLILEVIGLMLSIVGVVLALIDELGPRLQAAQSALHQLTEEINRKIPATVDAAVPVPTGEWRRNTEDPTN